MTVLFWLVVLALSLAVLVRAAGAFIASAEVVGLRYGLPPFVLGVTVVAFGTSFPELIAGVTAVLQGAPEVAIGTAVGSNVTNILLILGLAAALGKGLTVDHELVRVDLPYLFGSALLLWFFGVDGRVNALEGLLALAGLAAYVLYAASHSNGPATTVGLSAAEMAPKAPGDEESGVPPRTWLILIGAALLTQIGAYWTVESAVALADLLSIGSEVIAATAVALGTSLPELVVSGRSALAGKPEVAVGNVIGSNIFNALGVVGVSALFGTLTVPPSIAAFAMPAMLGVTVLAFFVLQEREVTRWDAWLLLVLYAAFLIEMLRIG